MGAQGRALLLGLPHVLPSRLRLRAHYLGRVGCRQHRIISECRGAGEEALDR